MGKWRRCYHKRQPRSCFELFVTRLNKSLRKLIVKFRCINKVKLLSFFLDYGFISGNRDVRKAKQCRLKIIDLLFPQSSFAMRTKRCYQIFHKARWAEFHCLSLTGTTFYFCLVELQYCAHFLFREVGLCFKIFPRFLIREWKFVTFSSRKCYLNIAINYVTNR